MSRPDAAPAEVHLLNNPKLFHNGAESFQLTVHLSPGFLRTSGIGNYAHLFDHTLDLRLGHDFEKSGAQLVGDSVRCLGRNEGAEPDGIALAEALLLDNCHIGILRQPIRQHAG